MKNHDDMNIPCAKCGTPTIVNVDRICSECYEKEHYYKKVNIPDSVRWEVWERDNFTCQQCGSRKNLAVDHIHPESKGGTLELSNLQTLCKKCNSRKWAK